MAEAIAVVGLTATVVTLLGASNKVLGHLYQFHSKFQEAPRTLRDTRTQLNLIVDIMEQIKNRCTDGSLTMDAKRALSPIVEDSLTQVTVLDGLIEKMLPTSTDSTLRRARKAIASSRKEKEVVAILGTLEKHMVGLTCYLSQESHKEMVAMRMMGCKSWLRPLDVGSMYQTKLPGTCDWIWTDPTFMKWNQPSSSDRLLCIYGTHGCGKSVLASSIVERLKSHQSQTLFFYFSGTDDSQRKLDSLVRTLLWQLQEFKDALGVEIVHKLMSEYPSVTPRLLDAFKEAARLVEGTVYCVIDGVDECIDDSTPKLLEYVQNLLNTTTNFRVVLLGRRHIPQANLWIKIDSSLIKHDIDAFIRHGIEKFPILKHPKLGDSVFKTLQEKSDGMFLWVELMIDYLKNSAMPSEVEKRLCNLPYGLEGAYRCLFSKLIEKLDDWQLDRAIKIFAFTTASCRALKVDELRYAYALGTGPSSTLGERLFLEPEQAILDVCGDLINITGGVVRLIHISVKEFLIRPKEKWLCVDDPKVMKFRVDLEATHRSLGLICVDYLGISEYGFPLHDPDAFLAFGTHHPFLEYASRHAIPHLNQSGPPSQITVDRINDFIESQGFVSWVEYLAMLLVDDVSNSMLVFELDTFKSWWGKGGHVWRLFEDKVRVSWRRELANRTRRFGVDDLRTEQWRNLVDLTESIEPDPNPGASSVALHEAPRGSSDAISQIMNFPNNYTTLPLHRQVGVILRLQSYLQRAKFLTDPLRRLLEIILLGADNIPSYVLLAIGMFYYRLNKLEDALRVFSATLTKVENREAPIKLVILESIGNVLWEQEKYQEAEVMYRRTLEAREKVLGKEHTSTLWSAYSLGCALEKLGKYEEAQAIHRQTLEGRKRALGKEHKDTLDSAYCLGHTLEMLERYEEAEAVYRQTLEARERVLGKEHGCTLWSAYSLGCVLAYREKYEEAEAMHRQTLKARERVHGKEHKITLESACRLGYVLVGLKKYDEAEAVHRQTLEAMEEVLGKEHAGTLSIACSLGCVLAHREKYEEAEAVHRQTLKARERVLGKEHEDTLWSAYKLGYVLMNLNKYEEAEAVHGQTLEVMEKVLGKEHTSTLWNAYSLGCVLAYRGKYEEAEAVHRQTLEARERVLGKEHEDTLWSAYKLGYVLMNLNKYEEAEAVHGQTLEVMEKVLGKEHTSTLWNAYSLGCVLEYRGKYEEAEAVHMRTLEARERVLGKEHGDTLWSACSLGRVLAYRGKYEEAEAMHRRTLEAREGVHGKEFMIALESAHKLRRVLEGWGTYKGVKDAHR
ncbi:hypothetical protein GP486_002303 [Trichoglossum hirsutum]|uniref:NACHT domain-containing protein n=1 Tax=Trichoglossum hirsutum TaxID=265104 RepID=A0A9P8RRT7_9PEZI|nr:hypothetical protein GP486_002303 [Trichoglossum hirsutum]